MKEPTNSQEDKGLKDSNDSEESKDSKDLNASEEFKDSKNPNASEESKDSKDQNASEESKETKVPEKTENNTIIIKVVPGDSSEKVSRKLEEAGLIEDADAFNDYLLREKLHRYVRVGEYKIEMGIEEEEIAHIIAK